VVLFVEEHTETPPPDIAPVAATETLMVCVAAKVFTGLSPGISPYSMMQALPLFGKSFHLPEFPHKCP
jgi:hypothetical protein